MITTALAYLNKKYNQYYFKSSNTLSGLKEDHTVLTNIFESTGGSEQTKKYNWCHLMKLAHTCDGVTINGEGRVVRLCLWNNNLSNCYPEIPIDGMRALSELHLNDNLLTGCIPAELGQLHALTLLDLANNQLTGCIPKELGRLLHLTVLRLFGNQLTGPIPVELSHLDRLKELILNENELSGHIPKELGLLHALLKLDLGVNKLTGCIPKELGQLHALRKLCLCFNQLTGCIPIALGHLHLLTHLDLGENKLTGHIPNEFGHLQELKSLFLVGNELSTFIPASMGQLQTLEYIYLGTSKILCADSLERIKFYFPNLNKLGVTSHEIFCDLNFFIRSNFLLFLHGSGLSSCYNNGDKAGSEVIVVQSISDITESTLRVFEDHYWVRLILEYLYIGNEQTVLSDLHEISA